MAPFAPLLLALTASLASALSVAPHPAPVHDPIASASALVARALGAAYVTSFSFVVLPADPETGNDVFTLSATANPVVIGGNSGVALSSGLGWYLKYTLNASWGWGFNNSGNNIVAMLPPPTAFPPPASPGRYVSPARFRYSWNTCTFGYSFPFYSTVDWQEEIDRIALWGINAPLLPIGLEAAEWDVYGAMGLTLEEMQEWFSGHSHLPWQRMANIKKLAGPLPLAAIEAQRSLGVAVSEMMTSFGMTPVLNGFAGHVPDALRRIAPSANISQSSDWGGVGCNESCVALLEPSDPLFSTLGAALNKRVLELYGGNATAPMFNADTFNEETPSSGDDAYLTSWNQQIYGAMLAAHNSSVFVIQGWAFHGSFWTPDRVRAYLSPVPLTRMLVLDLNSESGPVFQNYDGFFGHYFAWCGLIVFGGRRGVYGHLDVLGTSIFDARAAYTNLAGVGITPEAIDQCLPAFDILLETGWRREPVADVTAWLQGFAARRYGATGAAATLVAEAYTILRNASYNAGGPDLSVYEKVPKLGAAMSRGTNATGALDATRLLLRAAASMPTPLPSSFVYDLLDLVRGVGAAVHSDLISLFSERFTVGPQRAGGAAAAAAALKSIAAASMELLEDLDSVLATDANFMLGGFVERARALGVATGAPDLFVRDAKMLVSTWTEDGLAFGGLINDYSSRNGWSGLVAEYYAPRWALFNDVLVNATAAGVAPDFDAWAAANAVLQAAFVEDTATVWPDAPSGDPLSSMTKFIDKWAPVAPAPGNALALFDAFPGFELVPSAAPPSPTDNWVFRGADLAAVSSDCPFLDEPKLNTLQDCQAACVNYATCNFVNWDESSVWCVFRACLNPLTAALSPTPGYNAWALNRTGGGGDGAITAVLQSPGSMAAVCARDPLCVGFDSLGRVVEGNWTRSPKSDSNAWIKK